MVDRKIPELNQKELFITPLYFIWSEFSHLHATSLFIYNLVENDNF